MIGEAISFFVATFISLFTIINPFSTASVFHTIASGDSKEDKKYMARRAVITAMVCLIVFAFLGSYILHFFSITIEAFKIAGGLLVFVVGYGMIKKGHEHFSTKKEEKHAVDKDDVSIIPLAIPMLSGPGALTVAIVLMEEAGTNVLDVVSIVFAIILVCLFAYFLLINANYLDRYLKETGKRVVDKLMGLIVLVIGVQFIINGVLGVVLPLIV